MSQKSLHRLDQHQPAALAAVSTGSDLPVLWGTITVGQDASYLACSPPPKAGFGQMQQLLQNAKERLSQFGVRIKVAQGRLGGFLWFCQRVSNPGLSQVGPGSVASPEIAFLGL